MHTCTREEFKANFPDYELGLRNLEKFQCLDYLGDIVLTGGLDQPVGKYIKIWFEEC